MSDLNAVFAFEVSVAGTDWRRVVNERTAGAAKYGYWLDIRDCRPDVPITAMRCRKLGPPQDTIGFARTAAHRGLPEVHCGDRVRMGDKLGTIVGSNDSANFDVLFDGARGPCNVHPGEIEVPR